MQINNYLLSIVGLVAKMTLWNLYGRVNKLHEWNDDFLTFVFEVHSEIFVWNNTMAGVQHACMKQLRAHGWHMEHCGVVFENQMNDFCCTNKFTQYRSDRLQMLNNIEITNLTRIQCKSLIISYGCEKQAWTHSPQCPK